MARTGEAQVLPEYEITRGGCHDVQDFGLWLGIVNRELFDVIATDVHRLKIFGVISSGPIDNADWHLICARRLGSQREPLGDVLEAVVFSREFEINTLGIIVTGLRAQESCASQF